MRIPLAVKIAAWLMLVATVVACAPQLFEILTAQRGELLPMMFSTQSRVDGFGTKLPYLIYWTLCLTAGILLAAFTLRGSLVAYGILLVFMTWAGWDVVESIRLNGWPDASGLVTVLIAVLLLGGLPAYAKLVCSRLDARQRN